MKYLWSRLMYLKSYFLFAILSAVFITTCQPFHLHSYVFPLLAAYFDNECRCKKIIIVTIIFCEVPILISGGGGGVLPYVCILGMCRAS